MKRQPATFDDIRALLVELVAGYRSAAQTGRTPFFTKAQFERAEWILAGGTIEAFEARCYALAVKNAERERQGGR